MEREWIMVIGLLVLSILSGMLGLGVAFAAVPFLGLFFTDLVHQVQPLSLLLNGITALASAIGFARSRLLDWRRALPLSAITTAAAPLGAYLVRFVPQVYVWVVYFAAVVFLAYRMFRPDIKAAGARDRVRTAMVLAIPISILSGFLGVGPGFLLLPTLILCGMESKKAAAVNAFAVTPPSFSSLLPHWRTAVWEPELTLILLIAGAAGSFLGARLTSLYVPEKWMKQAFAILLVVVTTYKLIHLAIASF